MGGLVNVFGYSSYRYKPIITKQAKGILFSEVREGNHPKKLEVRVKSLRFYIKDSALRNEFFHEGSIPSEQFGHITLQNISVQYILK